MALEIKFLSLDRHTNVAGLNQWMKSLRPDIKLYQVHIPFRPWVGIKLTKGDSLWLYRYNVGAVTCVAEWLRSTSDHYAILVTWHLFILKLREGRVENSRYMYPRDLTSV